MTATSAARRAVAIAGTTALVLSMAACSSSSSAGAGTGAPTGGSSTGSSSTGESAGAAAGASTATSAQADPSTKSAKSSIDSTRVTIGPAVAPRAADWPTYHHDQYRTGTSSAIAAVRSTPRRVGSVKLDGAVYASPIIANGATIVVTENNTIYRISNNKIVWKHHVGAPVPGSRLPCGNINPSGITGTPAYDAATSTVVFVALRLNPIRHVAYAYDPVSGRKRWDRVVDVPKSVGGITPAAMQERGALLVYGRRVYIPYGGLAGDCSSYRGSVVGVDLDHPTTGRLWHYTIPTSREAGIWAPPGASANPGGGGLLVAAGNGATAGTGKYDFSDSVLRLANERVADSFSPSTWRTDNRDDLDLGSQGPAIVGKWVFIAGKSGTAYVLNRSHLGGIGGQVQKRSLCQSFGGTAVSGSVVFVPCKDGIRAVRIGSTGKMKVLWHASGIAGSPVLGGGRLWALDTGRGTLVGLDPATGKVKSTNRVGAVNRFDTPALAPHAVIVPTLSGVVTIGWT